MTERSSVKLARTATLIMILLAAIFLIYGADPSFDNYYSFGDDGDPVAINETTFPDETFRNDVSEEFDTDNDGQLSADEISEVTEINVSYEDIETLKGIEYFTAITYLDCSENDLTQLDVSKNTSLKELNCNNNKLTALDVSKNTVLEILNCSSNKLTALDVSENTSITDLNCSNNKLMALDVSENTSITDFNCSYNKLSQLDVSKNTALEVLDCRSNDLTQLDVSKNISLTQLYCSENNLTQLDVSKNTALVWLYCSNNNLTHLDISKNTVLEHLECEGNIGGITVNDQGQCDLAEIDGFDVSKASNWSGGTLDGTTLTPSADKVTYDYDCGNDKSATFTL